MDLVEGCYTNVKDQAFVDYICKVGVPKAEAEKMKGAHCAIKIEKCDGKWIGHFTCQECPEMNNLDSFREGEEKDVDHPMFGGKAKLSFYPDGNNAFKVKSVSEKHGVIEWTEKYCEDGITFNFHHKNSGATLKEFWCRKIKKSGVWFEMCKQEGWESYSKACGYPKETHDLTGYRMRFDMSGTDRCKLTELFGKHEQVNCVTLDEECDYDKGGPMEARLLVTKTGPNSAKWIFTSKRGQETWDMKFCSKGLSCVGTHKPSGQSVKIWSRPVCHIFGKYRMVSTANFSNYMCALGVPAEYACKMEQETDARLEIINEGCGWVRTKYHSKFMPMDVACKFGEEYEHAMPFPGGGMETFKCLNTLCGNTLMGVWKGSKWTVCSEMKFTGDWAIAKDKIKGTNICCTTILERC